MCRLADVPKGRNRVEGARNDPFHVPLLPAHLREGGHIQTDEGLSWVGLDTRYLSRMQEGDG